MLGYCVCSLCYTNITTFHVDDTRETSVKGKTFANTHSVPLGNDLCIALDNTVEYIQFSDTLTFTMFNHDEYYSGYWWIDNEDDWLNISLIAAPLMIVFGLALLITHKTCSKRASSPIYTPCSRVHSLQYDAVYVPTTCNCDGVRCDGNGQCEGNVVEATDSSAIPVVVKGNYISGPYIASCLATPDTYKCGLLSVSYSSLYI